MNSLSRGDVDGDKTAFAIADGLLANVYDSVAGAASAVPLWLKIFATCANFDG
jgi:hypothetical protein